MVPQLLACLPSGRTFLMLAGSSNAKSDTLSWLSASRRAKASRTSFATSAAAPACGGGGGPAVRGRQWAGGGRVAAAAAVLRRMSCWRRVGALQAAPIHSPSPPRAASLTSTAAARAPIILCS